MASPSPPETSRVKDPTLSATVPSTKPTTSKQKHGPIQINDPENQSALTSFRLYLYNRNARTYCDRTCSNWFYILSYSIIYLLFLVTYTLIFLFGSLWMLKLTTHFDPDHEGLTYSGNGIGLTATPTAETNYPIIWYRKGQSNEYEKYIIALDELLVKKRKKRDLETLGPCGKSPYGYGDNPCVVIRVNKQFHWAGKPLLANSTETLIAPVEVQNWLKQDKKLWLHCSGHHSYDKEHVGRIRYYPDPPGFDPSLFPLLKEESPVVAIQLSNFTLGLSVCIECKLWYVDGPSSVNFMLYVAQEEKVLGRAQ